MRSCIAHMRVWVLALSVPLLALPAALQAQTSRGPVGVVELFTSQGCGACPPADALLAELAQRDDVVALSYHVDYWDYLGWEDNLAAPENTARQRAYGEVFDNSVYTPQVVLNGRTHVVGSHRDEIFSALDERPVGGEVLNVDVGLSSNDRSIFVDIGAAPARKAAHILLVYYQPRRMAVIGGGENEGRSIEYRNIVTGFQTIGMWRGKAMRLELPRSDMEKKGGHCAVLLQAFDAEGRPGSILGAARTGDNGW